MNLEKYLDITPELQEAIKNGEPVVALESTILSHGMPYPENLSFAAEVEKEIRACGAHPATMALIGGKIKVGLSPEELELMCRGENVGKVSRRDFATYLATGKTGATTVASTMMCAALAGIHVFATGGIGGVHRHGEVTMDVSADLQELARTPVAVICAGAKQILDIGRTLEYLETMGVPVIGNGTSDFPAFFCKKSGFGVDYAAQSEEEIARIIKTKLELEMPGGVLIGNPIPDEYAMDFDYMEGIITKALELADAHPRQGDHPLPAGPHQGVDRRRVLRLQCPAGAQ
jgi:pseudouridine-5'-phosphate glycosidase